MKIIRFLLRFLVSIIIAAGIISLILWISGNGHVIKAVRSTYLVGKTGPTIDDFPKFENRKVAISTPQKWEKSPQFNSKSLPEALKSKIEAWETVGLVVIKDRKLVFEQYWNEYSEKSKTNSFSMAKSLTSLAIGAAIHEGKIKSIKQKVGDFLPEFSSGEKSEITIEHLLQMSSGIDFGESYGNPFGYMAKTYYGTDLYDLTVNKPMKHPAGTVWKYQGGNTLLLSFILAKATGKTLADYFSEQFWQPMGSSEEALWTLNESEGIEKSYCCFYSNPRDFARIGQLLLDSGKWNGKALISKDYFLQSLQPVMLPDEDGKTIDYYGFQWWMGKYKGNSFYYARGIQGQYIFAHPAWNMVIVRLGHERDSEKGAVYPKDIFDYLEVGEWLNE